MAGGRNCRLLTLAAAVVGAASAGAPPTFARGLGDWVQKEPAVQAHSSEASSWTRSGRVAGDRRLKMTVALRVDADRIAELERVLYEVSDPDHERYGRHLTREEVTALLAVPQERAVRTRGYLVAAGADKVETAANGDMLTVTISAAAAEVALNTRLHEFQHSEHTSAKIVRASAPYYLPAEIAEHVTMVGELLQFPRLPSKGLRNLTGFGGWPNSCDAKGCDGLVTPSVIAQRYKLPGEDVVVQTAAANSMAVAEFQGQFFNDTDLKRFSESCHRDVKVDQVIGEERQEGGLESELDIEYIKAVAPEIPLTVIYNEKYSLLDWGNQINNLTSPPLVHSMSYGMDEAQQTSTEYMLTCNTAFMKAGARGLSILFASGDQGVCGRDGCNISGTFQFFPDFPAASPYITAVGGTDFEGATIGPETTWNEGGGGFSDTFAIPAYQADAVAAYKKSPDAKLPPQQYWNSTGRGYPDVAALGGQKNAYCISVVGAFMGVSGTSASTPVVAGVFAKLNGLRLSQGKPALGFLNPFIYKNPSGFQDVTSGINDASTGHGFSAIKGWDAATGFGTPDFEALSGLVMGASGARSEREIVV